MVVDARAEHAPASSTTSTTTPGTPAVPLSDMNGMGRFWIGARLVPGLLGGLRAGPARYARLRAVAARHEARLAPRLARCRQRLPRPAVRCSALLALGGIVACGGVDLLTTPTSSTPTAPRRSARSGSPTSRRRSLRYESTAAAADHRRDARRRRCTRGRRAPSRAGTYRAGEPHRRSRSARCTCAGTERLRLDALDAARRHAGAGVAAISTTASTGFDDADGARRAAHPPLRDDAGAARLPEQRDRSRASSRTAPSSTTSRSRRVLGMARDGLLHRPRQAPQARAAGRAAPGRSSRTKRGRAHNYLRRDSDWVTADITVTHRRRPDADRARDDGRATSSTAAAARSASGPRRRSTTSSRCSRRATR